MENQTGPAMPLSDEPTLPIVHKNFFQKLPKNQQRSLLLISFLALFLPVVTAIAMIATRLNPRAYLPATPPVTSPVTPPYPSATVTIYPTTSITPFPTMTCVAPRSVLSGTCVIKSSTKVVFQNGRLQRRTTTTKGNTTISFTCADGYSSTYTSRTCQTADQLNAYAKTVCSKHICVRPTTTPTPTPTTIKITPTPIRITPTPLSTPSGSLNTSPVITTTSIPSGIVNKSYYTNIEASDPNLKDNLDMTISGLPFGLYQGPCAAPITGGKITCSISGTPGRSGLYTISAKVSDDHYGSSSKSFTLLIQSPVTPTPTPFQ